MDVDVETEIRIRRPPADVATFAGNPDNATAWYANIRSVEWKTPPPLRIGSRVAFVAHFLGRKLVYTYEIVELVEGRRLVMRTAQGPFPMETTYLWELAEDGTRMTLRNRGNPSGVVRFAAPLVRRLMRRENQKDLARLKEVMERTAVT